MSEEVRIHLCMGGVFVIVGCPNCRRAEVKAIRAHVHKYEPLSLGDPRAEESDAHVWDRACACGAKQGHAKGSVY